MDKDELTSANRLTKCIKREEERLKNLKEWITRITQEIDGLPHDHSYQRSNIEELTAQIVDCENNIVNLRLERAINTSKIIKNIDSTIEDNDQKAILIERYGFGRGFNDIAHKLHLSESRVFCLHRVGLRLLGIKKEINSKTTAL